jgi:hypothetical protein
MGAGRWDSHAWHDYARRNVYGRSREEVFGARRLDPDFNPALIVKRESRDSADNPQSTPIILASDVTGSMGFIAHSLMQSGLNTLATEIYERRPVSDPHVMVMAIGDASVDSAPLQVTQFEADIRLADQVRRLWIEGGGGANSGESYSGAHAFAGLRTDVDSVRLRAKKGYLFTIGDEPNLDGLSRNELERIFGEGFERGLSARECLSLAEQFYEVFHVVIMEGSFARADLAAVMRTWEPLLPGRILVLQDHHRLAETVVSAIQICEGANSQSVVASWDESAARVVARAIENLRPPAREASTSTPSVRGSGLAAYEAIRGVVQA